MKKTIKLGITLLVICMVAAGILGVLNEATKGPIAEIQARKTREALESIFNDLEDYQEVDIDEEDEDLKIIYEVVSGGEPGGYALTTLAGGFDGKIEIMTGFSAEGEILGVRILNHSETESIGSKITEEEYISQYDGKDANSEIEVDSITGATISSDAVEKGVNYAREIFSGL